MKSVEHRLDVNTSEADLLKVIDDLNNDPEIHGILCQLPLPKHLDEDLIINSISPAKDVDGFHISNGCDRPLQHCGQANGAAAAQ